jgi:hypothetical protein
MSATCSALPDYLEESILLHPQKRKFPNFDLRRLLDTVFTPTQGCKICVLVDFDGPQAMIQANLLQATLGKQVRQE